MTTFLLTTQHIVPAWFLSGGANGANGAPAWKLEAGLPMLLMIWFIGNWLLLCWRRRRQSRFFYVNIKFISHICVNGVLVGKFQQPISQRHLHLHAPTTTTTTTNGLRWKRLLSKLLILLSPPPKWWCYRVRVSHKSNLDLDRVHRVHWSEWVDVADVRVRF